MMWIDAAKELPKDHKQKLVLVQNIFQSRTYYMLAYYDPANRWGQVGGRVLKWMDLEELLKEACHDS